MEPVLQIWLQASFQAHSFIPAAFWKSQVEAMRTTYIPASDTYVYEKEGDVVGFYSVYEDRLAAPFVMPNEQGQGLGQQLLNHAKTQKDHLLLSVYKENQKSFGFYLAQGFHREHEQTDDHTGHPEYIMRWTAKSVKVKSLAKTHDF